MKKIQIKSKIDPAQFLYKPEDDEEEQDHRNTKLDTNIVDLTHKSAKELSPERKYQSLTKKKHNVKARQLLKLMRNGSSEQNTQSSVERVYSKENLDDYRSQFQLSYDKLSQKYYDALNSPSKIPDLYETTSDEDIPNVESKQIMDYDSAVGDNSLMSDDIVLPSQQDVEVVVYKKKRKLFDELYYTDLKLSSIPEDNPENGIQRRKTSTRPMTLSQVFEKSEEEVEEINLMESFIENEEEIVIGDDSNVNGVITLDSISAVAQDQHTANRLPTLTNNVELVISSDDSDDDIVIMQSQFNSPTKYDLEVVPPTAHENDTVEKKMSLTKINKQMTDGGIIFNNKELIDIITNDENVKEYLIQSSDKLNANILTKLSEQKNMSILKYELFEIFKQGRPVLVYDSLFRSIKKMINKKNSTDSGKDDFLQVARGLSLGRVFNLEYFTNVLVNELIEVDKIDPIRIKALSKLIHPQKLKSLFERRLGANFEMDSKKK